MEATGRARQTRRVLALTPELVARCGEAVPQAPIDRYTPASDEDYEAVLEHHLALAAGAPLRVFAYGSLIWVPGFEVTERVPGTALGWRRTFGLQVQLGRGSPEQPGYFLSLALGGRCRGVLLSASEANRRAALLALIRREYPFREFLRQTCQTRRIQVATSQGVVPALAFWAGRFALDDALDHTEEQVAHGLARARGFLGSGAEYLHRTILGLADHGIHDPYLWRLQRLVAVEITRPSFEDPRGAPGVSSGPLKA